jgi:hypothetical protein
MFAGALEILANIDTCVGISSGESLNFEKRGLAIERDPPLKNSKQFRYFMSEIWSFINI